AGNSVTAGSPEPWAADLSEEDGPAGDFAAPLFCSFALSSAALRAASAVLTGLSSRTPPLAADFFSRLALDCSGFRGGAPDCLSSLACEVPCASVVIGRDKMSVAAKIKILVNPIIVALRASRKHFCPDPPYRTRSSRVTKRTQKQPKRTL